MVPACTKILTHKMCQVGHRFQFGRNPDSYNSRFSSKDGFGNDIHFSQDKDPYYNGAASTHGIELHYTGGDVEPANPYTDPELAAAAVSPHEAVIQVDGYSHVVPFHEIDPDMVELACDDEGCALIPDDGYAGNDLELIKDHGSNNYGEQYVEPSYVERTIFSDPYAPQNSHLS